MTSPSGRTIVTKFLDNSVRFVVNFFYIILIVRYNLCFCRVEPQHILKLVVVRILVVSSWIGNFSRECLVLETSCKANLHTIRLEPEDQDGFS